MKLSRLSFKIEPYRILFPIGLFLSLWGVSIWIPFLANRTTPYPGNLHSLFMIGGFIFSFSAGFLMTAIPRFTQTQPATNWEILGVGLPLLLLPIASLNHSLTVFYFLILFSLTFLIRFAILHVIKKSTQPPESFLFIGIGLGSAFCGIVILFLNNLDLGYLNWTPFARLLFLQAFPLSLIVGVGSRLLPAIMGWRTPAVKRTKMLFLFSITGFIFVFSYYIEAFISPIYGRLIRSVLITLVATIFWRVLRPPPTKTYHTWGLWISMWMLLLGHWGATIYPNYAIHFLHLTFIGGIGLMTLLIATRVILAHGKFGLELEQTSKSILWIIGLALASAAARFSAGLIPNEYFSYLLYGAILWILMLLIWGWFFATKVLPWRKS